MTTYLIKVIFNFFLSAPDYTVVQVTWQNKENELFLCFCFPKRLVIIQTVHFLIHLITQITVKYIACYVCTVKWEFNKRKKKLHIKSQIGPCWPLTAWPGHSSETLSCPHSEGRNKVGDSGICLERCTSLHSGRAGCTQLQTTTKNKDVNHLKKPEKVEVTVEGYTTDVVNSNTTNPATGVLPCLGLVTSGKTLSYEISFSKHLQNN